MFLVKTVLHIRVPQMSVKWPPKLLLASQEILIHGVSYLLAVIFVNSSSSFLRYHKNLLSHICTYYMCVYIAYVIFFSAKPMFAGTVTFGSGLRVGTQRTHQHSGIQPGVREDILGGT
jgi:hypothetical protein